MLVRVCRPELSARAHGSVRSPDRHFQPHRPLGALATCLHLELDAIRFECVDLAFGAAGSRCGRRLGTREAHGLEQDHCARCGGFRIYSVPDWTRPGRIYVLCSTRETQCGTLPPPGCSRESCGSSIGPFWIAAEYLENRDPEMLEPVGHLWRPARTLKLHSKHHTRCIATQRVCVPSGDRPLLTASRFSPDVDQSKEQRTPAPCKRDSTRGISRPWRVSGTRERRRCCLALQKLSL